MRTNLPIITAVMIVCFTFAVQAKGPAKSGMNATVDKIAGALMQTAEEQFRAKLDCAGAETCIKVYDLDNQAYREYLIKAGEGFDRCGEKARAKNACESYLQKHGTDPSPIALLAAIEFEDKNYGRVVDLLKQIPSKVASQEQLCMILAEAHYAIGQYDETIALLSQAKSLKSRRAVELLALSSEKMGEYKTAMACYEKLVSLGQGPKRQEYAFSIARLYEDMDQSDMAMRSYERNIAEYPADLRNYERLASLHMKARNYRQAQQITEKAVSLPGGSPVLQKMLGACLAAQGNRTAAVNWYKKYLEAVPSDFGAWCELGRVYFEQEHYAEAIEVLKKSFSMQPKNSECLIILGTCHIKNGDMASAIEPFEAARTINKYDVRVLSQLAACYRAKHDTKNISGVLRDWSVADPKNSQPKFELGDMYVWDKKYAEAIPVLLSACELDSTDPAIRLSLARAYEKTGNESRRLLHLKVALAHGQTNAEALYEIGRFYASRTQTSAARPFLARSVSIEPDNAAARYEYGRVLKASGQNDSAYAHFEAALQAEPFNAAYVVQYAQAAYAIGKKEIALLHLRQAALRDSMNGDVLQWTGILYKECGMPDTAKQFLLRTITLNKACATCYKYLGDIYLANGEYDLAVKFFGQSLAVGSLNEGASISLGVSLFLSGDFDRARMMFEKTLSLYPKSDEVMYRLCSVYLRLGMLDKAKETFDTHKNGKKGGWIRLTEAEIAETEGWLDEALLSYTVASNLMPENPLAHAGAGRINLQKKQYEKATENFGNALGRDSHNADFLLGMGKAYEGMGQNQAAFDLYAEVARKSPKTPEVFYLMGRVLSKQNEHSQAVTALLRGIVLQPKNADLYFGLGHEYRALAKYKEAVESFKKSMRDNRNAQRLADAYKNIGDIYQNDMKEPGKAKDYYKKYLKVGGKDEKVILLVNNSKN